MRRPLCICILITLGNNYSSNIELYSGLGSFSIQLIYTLYNHIWKGFFQIIADLSFFPTQVAEQAGLQSRGQIGQLQGHYLLCSKSGDPASVWGSAHEDVLAAHPDVLWHSQEKVLSRSKRSLAFNDPSYPKQWHLVRIYPPAPNSD